MLNETQIEARRMIISEIGKIIEKKQKKADKEKAKQKNAFVTYKGDNYYSEAELQDAYGCDAFSSTTYDRLLDKLEKARGNLEADEFTPTEKLIFELKLIKSNLEIEIAQDIREKKKQEKTDARIEELKAEGYSFNEIKAIIGNEELMRWQ